MHVRGRNRRHDVTNQLDDTTAAGLNTDLKPHHSGDGAAARAKFRTKHQKVRGGIIKLTVSLVLLAVVYSTVRWEVLLTQLQHVSLGGFLVLVALYALGQLLSALKWRVFISSAGLDRSFGSVVRAYFFGMFVNVFGFGTLGGDLARCLAIRPGPGERAAAVATVVADRVHGLCVLLAVGVVSLAILEPKSLASLEPALLAGGTLGLILLTFGWCLGPMLLRRFVPQDRRWGQVLLRVAEAFPRDRPRIVKASVISFLFHNVQLVMHVVMARELLAPLSVSEVYATVPFVNIGSSVPISVMGVGVREGLYVVLFSPLGVPLEISVAFGALWLLVTSAVSAVGSVALSPEMRSELFAIGRGRQAAAARDADEESLAIA